jgi:hypothetical protein
MTTASENRLGEEVPQSEWATLFDNLNRRLEHGPPLFEVTIDVTDDGIGGTEAAGLPLNSITYEDGDDQIAIGVGGRGRRYPAVLWHFVDKPRKVRARREDDGAPSQLVIEQEDGDPTVLRITPER